MGARLSRVFGMHAWPFNHGCSARHHRSCRSHERVVRVLESVSFPRRADPNQLDRGTAHDPGDHPEEAADRLAIRELIDAYAHCADWRDTNGLMAP
jgi:hypothetical protein